MRGSYDRKITQIVVTPEIKVFVEEVQTENRNIPVAEVVRWSIEILQETAFVEYEGTGKYTELITNAPVSAEQYDFIHARAAEKYSGNVSAAMRDAFAALQLRLKASPEKEAATK